jgi:cellulase (glycosyl hydrolase family 5)
MKALVAALGIAFVTLSATSAPASAEIMKHKSAIPHGFTLDGLQDWLPPQAAFERNVGVPRDRIILMEAQIHAARYVWKANVVRFQIIQDKLVGANGQVFSPVYMQDIRTVTDYAMSLGLQVVLNAQTEVSTGFTRDESLPTRATRSFWHHIMGYYKNNPRVIFDLFNEPRKCSWKQWRRAMQGLLDYVRHSGAHNTVWVEGRWWGSTLAGVPLLHGKGIVYSFHHPGSPWPSQAPVTTKTWNKAFGKLARRGIPVVDGEFVNYSGGYQWKNPAVTVPKFLRYLTAHHIGMTAWTLGLPGVLNSTSDLASVTTEPHGCGQLIKSWFARM